MRGANASEHSAVETTDWGVLEPGEVGRCVVMDSKIRWTWNAIGCVISAHGSCHGSPHWCPSPPLPPAAASLSQSHFTDQTVLQLSCQEGYKSDRAVTTQCLNGFWTPFSLTCSPIDCGRIETGDVEVKYLNVSKTGLGSLAIVSCKEDNLLPQTTVTCVKASLLCILVYCFLMDIFLCRRDGVGHYQTARKYKPKI